MVATRSIIRFIAYQCGYSLAATLLQFASDLIHIKDALCKR